MLNRIHLTNFKVHQDLKIEFGAGLQTIRGEVEAGKSSLIEAVAYGLFGSAALPATLAETVTWGQPESSLRVELEFTHAGQPFSIYRGKSGAELTGVGVRASGQAEVTRFCEGLFGCSAAVAKQVLLASQGDLRGALDAGPGEAVQLIEKLGNVDLLDSIVSKIQDQLPCGGILTLETLIGRDAEVFLPEAVDHSERLDAMREAARQTTDAAFQVEVIQARLATLDVAGANQALGEARAEASRVEQAQARLRLSSDALSLAETALRLEEALPVADLEMLIQQQAQAGEAVRQRRVLGEVTEPGPALMDLWEGSLDDLNAEMSRLRDRIEADKSEGQRQALLVAGLSAQRITETACGLCGKDLANIPEVVLKNESLDARIAESTDLQVAIKSAMRAATKDLDTLQAVQREDARRRELAQSHPDLVRYVATDCLPGDVIWRGPSSIPKVGTNFDKQIKAARVAQELLARLRQGVGIARASHAAALAEANEARAVNLDTSSAQAILDTAQTLEARLAEANACLQVAKTAHRDLTRALEQARAVEASQTQAFDAAQARLVALRRDLAAVHLHNRVIKRVREARPVVANKLWDLVLCSVSQYFSKVRGAPSVVSRGEKGFSVDGRPVRTLSGSTKDALGLAIRLSLAKTFLPALGFLILDEPAAACDDVRESAMLGLLSACDFDQILMVTHSELADAYSTNIIQL